MNEYHANVTLNGVPYDIPWNGDSDTTVTGSKSAIGYYRWPEKKNGYIYRGERNEKYGTFAYGIRVVFNINSTFDYAYIKVEVQIQFTADGEIFPEDITGGMNVSSTILNFVKLTSLNSFSMKVDFVKDA